MSSASSSAPTTASIVRRADLVPALDQLHELVDDRPRLLDLLLLALERQLVAAHADGDVEAVAERVEHAVVDPGQLGRDLVGDVEDLLHALSVGAARSADDRRVLEPGRDELVGGVGARLAARDRDQERRLAERVEADVGLRDDRGRPRHVAHERDLAEAVAAPELRRRASRPSRRRPRRRR